MNCGSVASGLLIELRHRAVIKIAGMYFIVVGAAGTGLGLVADRGGVGRVYVRFFSSHDEHH